MNKNYPFPVIFLNLFRKLCFSQRASFIKKNFISTLMLLSISFVGFCQLNISPSSVDLGDICDNQAPAYSKTFLVMNNTADDRVDGEFDDYSQSKTITNIVPSWFQLEAGQGVNVNISGTVWPGLLGRIEDRADLHYELRGTTYSMTGPAIVLFAMKKPTSPYNLTVSNITNTSFILNWNCDYYAKTTFDLIYPSGTIKASVNNVLTATLTNLSPASSYELRVASRNKCGNGGYSNNLIILTKPSTPANFTKTVLANGDIRFSWNACSGIIDGYRIYRNGVLFNTTTSTSFTYKELCYGTLDYYVVAYNSSGESNKSSTISYYVPLQITGSNLICYSNASFSVNGPVPLNPVWTKSSNNLSIISGQNSNTFTVKASSTNVISAEWVQVTVTPAGCPSRTVKKDIWVGKPLISGYNGPYYGYTSNCYRFTVIPVNNNMGGTYTWSLDPLNGNYVTSYGNFADFDFYYPGVYQIKTSVTNTCGSYSYFRYLPITAQSGAYSVSPNPASSYVRISKNNDLMPILMSDSTFRVANSDFNEIPFLKSTNIDVTRIEYDIKIFNQSGNLVASSFNTELDSEIPIENLPIGIYIIEISDGSNTEKQKLIIDR